MLVRPFFVVESESSKETRGWGRRRREDGAKECCFCFALRLYNIAALTHMDRPSTGKGTAATPVPAQRYYQVRSRTAGFGAETVSNCWYGNGPIMNLLSPGRDLARIFDRSFGGDSFKTYTFLTHPHPSHDIE